MSDRIDHILRGRADDTQADPRVVEMFRGKTVLVTGAAGSVGAEICRQVLRLPIKALLAFDRDENSLFELSNALGAAWLQPIVGDIRDRVRVAKTFAAKGPHIVLHAAAYKHVSMMENNSSEAVLNNVAGTRILAETAADSGAERFLMISTDKAVNPVSVMGASKRLAEMVVQSVAGRQREGGTRFACVRFGNVTGSRGSVIPIFTRQIAAGGPVTLTDERMTRYFMSNPEAVHLVLEASILGQHGEIYMFDMGEPVLIQELARKMIELSGKPIELRVIGSRPGEKLHEELIGSTANAERTAFDRVLRVPEEPLPADFPALLSALEGIAAKADDSAARIQLFNVIMPRAFVGSSSGRQ